MLSSYPIRTTTMNWAKKWNTINQASQRVPLKVKRGIKIAVVSVLCLCIVSIFVLVMLPDSPIQSVVSDFLSWIKNEDGNGLPQYLACIIVVLLYMLTIVMAMPGTPINLASGFLFDMWPGALVALAGSAIGSAVAFILGRTLLRGWAESFAKKRRRFKDIDRAVASEGFKLVFLLRLSPAFPFSVFSYLLGVTNVSFWKYVLATNLGNAPFSIVYTYFGSIMRDLSDMWSDPTADASTAQQWIIAVVIIIITVVVMLLAIFITARAIKKASKEHDNDNEIAMAGDQDDEEHIPSADIIEDHELVEVPMLERHIDSDDEITKNATPTTTISTIATTNVISNSDDHNVITNSGLQPMPVIINIGHRHHQQ
eukprot:GEZU01003138.1.p1 GENE.GEZU01003138.1~~GEZU01003138.1.p1  ORF type:complete len:369 (-),score=82.59 GEZU01003138.1:929-2035(-)